MLELSRLLMLGGLTIIPTFAIARSSIAIDNNEGFLLPSRNIVCISDLMTDRSGQESPILRCEILSKLNPMPPQPKSCNLDWGNGLGLTATAKTAEVLCVGDTMYSPTYPILKYGKTWQRYGFSCKATKNGVACNNGKGNGFTLGRTQWKAY